MTTGDEWVPRKDGEWYQGPDGFWYCWPSREAYPIKPVDETATHDVPTYSPRSAPLGSALAQVDSVQPVAPEWRTRNPYLLPLAAVGLVVVLAATVLAFTVGGGGSADRISVQEVSAAGSGMTPITLANGRPGVSWAVTWSNRSRDEYARAVTVRAGLTDATGAVVMDLSQTIPMIAPGQTVAIGGEQELSGATMDAQLTTGQAEVGTWLAEVDSPVFATSEVQVGPVQDGLVDVTGKVVPSASGSVLRPLRAVAVFYGADDQVLGGATSELPAPTDRRPFGVLVTARPPTGVQSARIFVVAT